MDHQLVRSQSHFFVDHRDTQQDGSRRILPALPRRAQQWQLDDVQRNAVVDHYDHYSLDHHNKSPHDHNYDHAATTAAADHDDNRATDGRSPHHDDDHHVGAEDD
jgi:hypothetical protein